MLPVICATLYTLLFSIKDPINVTDKYKPPKITKPEENHLAPITSFEKWHKKPLKLPFDF